MPLPRHGTLAGYKQDGCRLSCCRRAVADRERERFRAKAYGRYASHAVDPVGARRRLQALATLGWSPGMIADRYGVSATNLGRIRAGRVVEVTRALDAVIRQAYDELWDSVAPRERSGQAERCRRNAQRKGWLPPLDLDDDTIDDPMAEAFTHNLLPDFETEINPSGNEESPALLDEIAIERAMRGDRVPLTSPEKSEAIRRLAAMRLSDAEIGVRLHMTTTAVCQRRLRAGIESRVAVAAKWRAVA